MCVLTAYMEESGVHDKDWCVVAGFVGDDKQWKDCIDKWKPGLGRSRSLHMRKLRWNKTERVKKLLNTLGPIPESCGLKKIWAGLRLQDYEDLLPQELRLNQEISPYMLCTSMIFARTAKLLPVGQRVAFVFALQKQYSRLVALPEWFLRNFLRDRFTVTYLTERTMLTEPADYLAFEIRQCQIDINSKKARLGHSIIGDGQGYGAIATRDGVRRVMTNTIEKLARLQKSGLVRT
jgi:hypothetical protein